MPLCKLHCIICTGFAVYKNAHTGLSTTLSLELEDEVAQSSCKWLRI